MGVEEAAKIIINITDGFKEAVITCLEENSDVVITAVTEQLYCGKDGEGEYLEPTYDNDPFFNEKGPWQHRSEAYKQWKQMITPPGISRMLGLEPRPVEVPNLCIDGTFYSQITASRRGDELYIDPGNGNGPEIVEKYGEQILELGPTAVRYFNEEYLMPHLEGFFSDCGYK